MKSFKFALVSVALSACAVHTPPPGSIALYWTFGNPALDCASSGVTDVSIIIDGSPLQTVPCVGANNIQGIQISNFSQGPHQFELQGFRGNNTNPTYDSIGQVTVLDGQLATANVDLTQQRGDLTINPLFEDNSGSPFNCADARITKVTFELYTNANPSTFVASTDQNGAIDCESFTVSDLALGSYYLRSIAGLAQGNNLAFHTYNLACGVAVDVTGDSTVTVDLPASNAPSSSCP